ncbi:UvrD-helicase domain-containing protein [Methylosarcina fibrata]|uniref:UvrD-helicase domain-containing protein n=1 Tax=Methylosarcina fibrata TaxID=105972 RepID=UPI00038281A1|nr:UvrD-helicase domain-containing protein [Methylosarcina fibrata]
MVSKQTLLQLVDALVPEIDVNDVIPDIEAKHDEILAIAEAANELRTLSLFQEKVDAELALKRTVDPARAVINASSVKLNFNRNAEIAMLEELKQRSYGKVVTVKTPQGELKKYRIAQANYSIIKANNGETIMVVNRMAPVAGILVSAEIDDEFVLPQTGEVVVVAVDLLDRYEIGEQDNFSRMQYWNDQLSTYSDINNDFTPLVLENLKQQVARWRSEYAEGLLGSSKEDVAEVFSEDSKTSLGSNFYTRTTKAQEELLRRPRRGLVIVEGIAGSGKTSVALGRVKALHDARIENPDEPADLFFADKSRMVGFVLHKQLVNYLEQTVIDLNLAGMRVIEFKELQNNLLRQRGGVLQLKMPGNPSGTFARTNAKEYGFESTMPWLHTIDRLMTLHFLSKVDLNLNKGVNAWLSQRLSSKTIPIDYTKLVGMAWEIARKEFANSYSHLQKRKSGGFYSEGLVKSLKEVYISFSGLVSENARWYHYDNTWHLKAPENQILLHMEPFNGRNLSRDQIQWLKQFRQDIRTEFRKTLLLDNAQSHMPMLTTWYAEILNNPDFNLEAEFGKGIFEIRQRINEQKLADSDLNLLLAVAHLMSKGNQYSDEDQSRLASYLSEPIFYSTVFIDEVQDFTEIQVFLMSEQADPQRRAVTVVGDFKQQLYPSTVIDLGRCFPKASSNEKESAKLEENKRQTKNLANFSAQFREKIGEITGKVIAEPIFQGEELTKTVCDEESITQKVLDLIIETPVNKSIAVICPTNDQAKHLEHHLRDDIQQNFRESQYSEDHRDLNKSLYVHFTVARPTKGLEFDVVIAPYFNSYDLIDHLQANSAYVTVSRPREQLHLIETIN